MKHLRLLLVLSLIESFATICVERGIYFLSTEKLSFAGTTNLWLALGFGIAYAGGALLSQRMATLLTERRLLLATLWAQVLAHVALAMWWQRVDFIFAGSIVLGFVNGMKWPIVESYISAGKTPAQTARAVGLFNISWALAVPLALVAAGPIIASPLPQLLFLIPAGINIVSILLISPLDIRPVHLAADHPDRPGKALLVRMRSLLAGSRWMLLCSYATMWILAALMPHVFLNRLKQDVDISAGLSGLLDVVRLGTFVVLQVYTGWHYRRSYLLGAIIALPIGFFLVLYGPTLASVLIGEVIFGLAAGLIYYSALYYAMVVHSAAVEAGGAHEGLIGGGFALGPIAALAGVGLAPFVGGLTEGMIVGIGPVFVICSLAAMWNLRRATNAIH